MITGKIATGIRAKSGNFAGLPPTPRDVENEGGGKKGGVTCGMWFEGLSAGVSAGASEGIRAIGKILLAGAKRGCAEQIRREEEQSASRDQPQGRCAPKAPPCGDWSPPPLAISPCLPFPPARQPASRGTTARPSAKL